MEKYNNDDILKAVNDLIEEIKNSHIYIRHLQIRKQLSKNKDILDEIQCIKKLKQAYVKSNFSNLHYKNQINDKLLLLRKNPLYKMYEESLNEINEFLIYFKDGLNEFFYDLLN